MSVERKIMRAKPGSVAVFMPEPIHGIVGDITFGDRIWSIKRY